GRRTRSSPRSTGPRQAEWWSPPTRRGRPPGGPTARSSPAPPRQVVYPVRPLPEGPMTRLAPNDVQAAMKERPDATLEGALEVFEVFASGSLTDEVYILEDVAGKRIAIAPTALRDKYRRG